MSQATKPPMFNITKDDHVRASTRGSSAMKAIYYIDGKPAQAEEVMARTGWTKNQVIATIRRERDMKRLPLTWARIDEIAARRRGEA
ncbi:MAG: hypothetical protein ACK5PF_09645 [bacterium]